MGQMIIKVFAVLALAFLVSFGVFKGIPDNQKNYLAGLNDKQERIESLMEKGEPKMVLVGGSNVAFGLHSGMLEEAFDMPVANMAIHAGLRYEYMVNQVWETVEAGDVYVLCAEYSQMYEPLSTGGPIIYQSLEVFPEGMNYVHQGNVLDQIQFQGSSYIEIVQIKLKRTLGKFAGQAEKNAYQRSVFDEYGDIWSDQTLKSRYDGKDKHMDRNRGKLPSEDFVRITNEFAEHAESKGAKVLFLFPAIAEAKWDAEVAEATQAYLEQELDVPIVNDPAEYVMANDQFFDTKYHTTQAGRVVRTEKTISDLLEFIR
jgi:hypothetical protein